MYARGAFWKKPEWPCVRELTSNYKIYIKAHSLYTLIGRGILDSEGSGGGDRGHETVWFEYAVSAAPEDLKRSVTQAQRLLTQHTSRFHLREQVLERATNGRQENSSEGLSLYKKISAFCAGAQ